MKKALLLMSAMALTTAASYATFPQEAIHGRIAAESPSRVMMNPSHGAPERAEEESIGFSYADEYKTLYQLNNSAVKDTIYLAFKFAKEDQVPYIGTQITGLDIIAGMQTSSNNNCFSNVFAYISEDMNAKPTGPYVGKDRMSTTKPGTAKYVALNNPYTITGEKDIYVGYYFRLMKSGYYVPTDKQPTDKPTCLVYRARSAHSSLDMENCAEETGSLACWAVITGDNLPKDAVSFKDLAVKGWFPVSEKISYKMTLSNMGANALNEVVVSTEIDGNKVDERTISFTTPLANNKMAQISIDGLSNPGEGSHELRSTVVKVNGVEPAEAVYATGNFVVSDLGFTRRVVVEEGTGTWCGWCPRGIVMMEYFKEHYPTWIRIGVHSGDEMYTNTYARMINRFFGGFPSAIANRETAVEVAGDEGSYYVPIATKYEEEPAMVRVNLEASCSDGKVNVTTTTDASVDYNLPLQLAFVLVEDGVGPYEQQNNYANGVYGAMGGWEDKPDPAETIYDDVARLLEGYPGIANSVPASLVKGEKYTFDYSISLTRNGKDLITGDSFRVVALLVNPDTGVIMNANEITVSKETGAVEGITDEAVGSFRVENGAIVSNAPVQVYTLDGRRVSPANLQAGVYIVSCNGTTKKILVK